MNYKGGSEIVYKYASRDNSERIPEFESIFLSETLLSCKIVGSGLFSSLQKSSHLSTHLLKFTSTSIQKLPLQPVEVWLELDIHGI